MMLIRGPIPTLTPTQIVTPSQNPCQNITLTRRASRYQLVAVDFLQPAAVGLVMKRLAVAAVGGHVGALSLSRYGLSSAAQAMRLMSQVSSRFFVNAAQSTDTMMRLTR